MSIFDKSIEVKEVFCKINNKYFTEAEIQRCHIHYSGDIYLDRWPDGVFADLEMLDWRNYSVKVGKLCDGIKYNYGL